MVELTETTLKKAEKRLESWLKIVKRIKHGEQEGECGHFKYGGPGI